MGEQSAASLVTLLKVTNDTLVDLVAKVTEPKSLTERQCTVYAAEFIKHHNEFQRLFTLLSQHPNEQELIQVWSVQLRKLNATKVDIDCKLFREPSKVNAPVTAKETSSSVGFDSHARLPQISLPTFDGNMLHWMTFIELFESLIYSRKSFDNVEKHYYLRASLTGEPLSLIQHLPCDSANFEIALKILKSRYQNTRLLADQYIERILQLPQLPNDAQGLRSLFYNPLVESSQALTKLGLPIKNWSYMLVHIILKKLPLRLRTMFEERYGKQMNVLPTFEQLIEFLDETCRLYHQLVAEQAAYVPTTNPSNGSPQRQRFNANSSQRVGRYPRVAAVQQTASMNCAYCKGTNHSIYRCNKFNMMPVHARRTWVQNAGKCFKCLRGHFKSECNTTGRCKNCNSDSHNTLLCSNAQRNYSSGQRSQSRPTSPRVPHITPHVAHTHIVPPRSPQGLPHTYRQVQHVQVQPGSQAQPPYVPHYSVPIQPNYHGYRPISPVDGHRHGQQRAPPGSPGPARSHSD